MTVVPPADSDLRRYHMYLYASVPDFILQNNLAAKIMLFNLPVNSLSYRIEFRLFVDNRLQNRPVSWANKGVYGANSIIRV
jgi:hypothetical protein